MSRATVALLYVCGVTQGLALVTFPATGPIFVDPARYALSSGQYGAMFVPQVAFAILAAALAPTLARRIGMRGVLTLGLTADLVAMALLTLSSSFMREPVAFLLLLLATGALGLGFGTVVMSLNASVEAAFAQAKDGAVLALNALLGLGTALAPALAALFTALGDWRLLPLGVGASAMLWLVSLQLGGVKLAVEPAPGGQAGSLPFRVWLYSAAALLYGVVETLCGNWATIYLQGERHFSLSSAALALTAFWGFVTIGRIALAGAGRWIPGRIAYVALPLALAALFPLVAVAGAPALAVAAFALAGLACSGLLPLTVSLSAGEFPARASFLSGELIAAYQIGVGLAAFGVGPLHARGLSYAELFLVGGGFAIALAAVAFALALHRPSSGTSRVSAG